MLRASLVGLVVALVPALAVAETSVERQCRSGEQECTEQVFTDADLLEAGLQRPGEDQVRAGRGMFRRPVLIRARVDFIDEIVQSGENL